MRPIDRIAIRSPKPRPIEELRGASMSPQTLAEQRQAHIIDLARYLADIGADTDLRNIKASERREVDRRRKVIAELEAGIPETTSVRAAQWRLLNPRSIK